MKVCAVIPAYNEGRRIAEVVRGALAQGLATVVVDDCSDDATSERALRAGAAVVRHERNRGKGAALATGLAWATERGYDAAVTLDGDGQHDPEEIPLFIKCALERGADIVVGSRFLRLGGKKSALCMPPVRKFTNWFMSRVLSGLAGARLTDSQSGYRLIKTKAWESLDLDTSGFDTESEMLVRACRKGMHVAEVPIRTIYGDEESSIRPVRETIRWVRLLWRLRGKGKTTAD